jgi:hypothetical protein
MGADASYFENNHFTRKTFELYMMYVYFKQKIRSVFEINLLTIMRTVTVRVTFDAICGRSQLI